MSKLIKHIFIDIIYISRKVKKKKLLNLVLPKNALNSRVNSAIKLRKILFLNKYSV